MTIVECAAKLAGILRRAGYEPVPNNDKRRLNESETILLNHVCWLCNQIVELNANNSIKYARCLGFAQGVMWSHGLIDNDNNAVQSPPNTKFEPFTRQFN